MRQRDAGHALRNTFLRPKSNSPSPRHLWTLIFSRFAPYGRFFCRAAGFPAMLPWRPFRCGGKNPCPFGSSGFKCRSDTRVPTLPFLRLPPELRRKPISSSGFTGVFQRPRVPKRISKFPFQNRRGFRRSGRVLLASFSVKPRSAPGHFGAPAAVQIHLTYHTVLFCKLQAEIQKRGPEFSSGASSSQNAHFSAAAAAFVSAAALAFSA